QPVLALGPVHLALGPAARAVGEDDALTGPQALHGDGVPSLRPVQHVPARRVGAEAVDDEHWRGHRAPPSDNAVRAAASSAASTSTSRPAGRSRASRWPWPAHSARPCGSPALAAALRRGAVRWWTSG